MRKTIKICVFVAIAQFIFNYSTAAEKAIRGVWVPAPKFTDVLHTYNNIQKFVSDLDELNFNAIFLVSYAQNKTIYPSKVLQQYGGFDDVAKTNLLDKYVATYDINKNSPSGDPIKDLIMLAHQRNIKVFFWYEYGFMGDTKPITKENPLLANNPDWLGVANDGTPAAYHNKDFYFNAYNPKVQDYLIKLIIEGIKLYPEIDGIQGDDRLPAMPKNSGYDRYTINKYKAAHKGQNPPQDFNDENWVNWRINLLNQFGKRLYQAAHKVKKDIIVSFAPNPYPWSKENLMQDWPTWVENGICDLLAVQCYRYNAQAYRNTVKEAAGFAKKNNSSQLFAPGIILMEGGKIKMSAELLREQIKINRDLNINGEIFFYNEALKDSEIRQVFLDLYKVKVEFPKNAP